MSAAECITKAAVEPACGDHVQHRAASQNSAAICECWIKNPCCGTCKPVEYDFRNNWRFNVYSVPKPIPDPTCQNGTASADGAHCCPKSCGGTCLGKPLFEISFQPSSMRPPYGTGLNNEMAVDSGETFRVRTTPYPSFTSWGWNCDLTTPPQAEDREPGDLLNFHSTFVKPDFATCGAVAQWDLLVGANGTAMPFEVHTLHSRPFTSISGCKLNGQPHFDPNHSGLGNSDMAWVVRAMSTSTGRISWSGAQNANSCGGISAMRVYPQTENPAVDCQTKPGICCPQFVEMASRPCSQFAAPCSLI